MHPIFLLMGGPVSPKKEMVVGYHPLYDLLMMGPPPDAAQEQEDLAAIFGSTLGVILPWYMKATPEPLEDVSAIFGSTVGILAGWSIEQ